MRRASQTAALGLLVVLLAIGALSAVEGSAVEGDPGAEPRPTGGIARAEDAPPSAPEPIADAGRQAAALRDGQPLDVNRATADELRLLPGIGPALSARIVENRLRHGRFDDVSDLRRVRGIGPRTVERLAALVTAGPVPDAGP